jgi:hypothetical protein
VLKNWKGKRVFFTGSAELRLPLGSNPPQETPLMESGELEAADV